MTAETMIELLKTLPKGTRLWMKDTDGDVDSIRGLGKDVDGDWHIITYSDYTDFEEIRELK
ncbi:hypothetical protein E4V51_30725 [Paenibacillus sp. 28ISP30-2]|nr:hypothetical protein [Paenibacillus sp. 28ISP30-2]